MDFLKSLSLSEDKDNQPAPAQGECDLNPRFLLGGTQRPTAPVPPPPQPPAEEHHGFLHNLGISSGKEDEGPKTEPVVPVASTATEETERHGISSFFSGHKTEETPAAIAVVDSTTATTVRPEEPHHYSLSSIFSGEKEQPITPPAPVVAVPEPVKEDKGFLHDLIHGDKPATSPTQPTLVVPAVPIKPDTHHSILDHIISKHEEAPQAPIVPPPPPPEESLFDKIGSHFNPKEDVQAPAPVPPKQEEEHFIDRISSHFGTKTPPPPPPPKPRHEQFLEKIGVHSEAVVPPPEQSLTDKLLHLHDKEPDKMEETGFKNKVSSFLGAKTEKEEGK